MCGRYALHANPDVIKLQFGLGGEPEFKALYNICPSMDILAVREGKEGHRIAKPYRWGLIPSWTKDASIGNKLANARGETVAEKPAFREAFRRRRCLVPASGFYEWKSTGGKKYPYYIRPQGEALFGLAGITEYWEGPQGAIRTVCLITTAPNELMAGIHDRMPVIVAPERYGAWLDRGLHHAGEFIRPYPAERMHAHPVGSAVSHAGKEGPELIKPVDAATLF